MSPQPGPSDSWMKTAETQPKRQLNQLPFDPELTPGARNAVQVCLRVQPSEKVTVITDLVTVEIAAALGHELEAVGCRYNSRVLEDVAAVPRPALQLTILE